MPSTKIVISGEIRIDPDDHDAALALIEPLVAATRQETGCIEYGFWLDPVQRGTFRVYEEWASAETNAAHSESTHYLDFLTAVSKVRVLSVDLFRFEVASKTPLAP